MENPNNHIQSLHEIYREYKSKEEIYTQKLEKLEKYKNIAETSLTKEDKYCLDELNIEKTKEKLMLLRVSLLEIENILF